MKRPRSLKRQLQAGASFAILASAIYAISLALVTGADTSTNSTAAAPPADTAKKAPTKLTGTELYAIHCNRCHPERYPTERTAAQWKTLLTHMRVRANLPADQAKAILKYLQEESGTP